MKACRSNKYHNRRAEADGIVFASAAERNRYIQLKMLQSAGMISGLVLQKPFELIPGKRIDGKPVRGITYVADFVYTENGQTVVEDVKGAETEGWKLKQKMMLLILGIRIRVIDAKTLREKEKCKMAKKTKGRTKSGCWTIS